MLTIQKENPTIPALNSEYTSKSRPQYPVIASYEGKRALKEGFQPSKFDVICGRGKAVKNHPGNVRFLQIVEDNLKAYKEASSKLEKSLIVSEIIDSIRRESPEGGFVKEEGGHWYEVGDHLARERVGQRLRDLLSSKYSSSSGAKKRRRRADEDVMMKKLDEVIVNDDSLTKLSDRIQELSSSKGSEPTDEELQSMFNQANMDLLQKIKEQNLCADQNNENHNSMSSLSTASGSTNCDAANSSNKKRKYDESDDDSCSDSTFDPIPVDYDSCSDSTFDPIPVDYDDIDSASDSESSYQFDPELINFCCV